MKYTLTLLLSLVIFYINAQKNTPIADSCFTKKQVLDISFTLDSLLYLDSINNEIIKEYKLVIHDHEIYNKLDSTIIAEKQIQIKTLQNLNTLYIEERNKYNKWYYRNEFWYGLGVATTTILVKIISGFK